MGKPTHAHWRDCAYGSLLRLSGDIGIYAIEGDPLPAVADAPLAHAGRLTG